MPLTVSQLAAHLGKLDPYERWNVFNIPVERYSDTDHYCVGPPLHGVPQCPRSATEAASLILRWTRQVPEHPSDRPFPARYTAAMEKAKIPRPEKRPPHPPMYLPPWVPPTR
jgi:hypothetical protein